MNDSPEVGDGLDHVRYLADTIGKRVTGSEGERRAAEYQCGQLREWGCEDVGTEEFPARGWDFETCSVHCDQLGTLEALPIEFSGSTPAGGTQAELVVCEKGSDVVGDDIAGKIALFCGGLPDSELLLEHRPAGVILVESTRALAWHQIIGPSTPLAGQLPLATLGFADAVKLVRHGVTRLKLEIETTIEEVTGHNVVATLPGSGDGSRRINISGHYDSVPAGGAAADNATGAACALEVVRSLSQLELDVAIDFVNFSATAQLVKEMATVANAADVPCWVQMGGLCLGVKAAYSTHVQATIPNATLPCDELPFVRIADVLSGALVVENGHFLLPEGPGLGVTLDMAVVEKYRVG